MKKFSLMVLALVCSLGAFADTWCFNGNAAQTGWTDGDEAKQVNAFTEDADGKLVWIGKLVTGGEGFKICHNGSGFGGWGDVHPSTAGLDITSVEYDSYVEGGDDTKWTVPADGIYKMTIDPELGILTCVPYTPTIAPAEDGWYEIGTAEELYEFAELVSHNAIDAKANVRLTDNIDYFEYPYSSIGRSRDFAYAGTFDGQGHNISIAMKDIYQRTGLFAYVYKANIKHLNLSGVVTLENHNCGGGLGGRSDGDGTKVENVLVYVSVYYNHTNNDATAGGFFANMEGNVTLKNCMFMGSIETGTAEGNGGFVGWAGGGSQMNIENCLFMPTGDYTKNGNSADYARNNPTVKDSYAISTEDERLVTGEMCYLLNGKVSGGTGWIQNLGDDGVGMPVPAGSYAMVEEITPNIVYANGSFNCDGTPKEGVDVVYSNEDASIVDPHAFGENGVCTACHNAGQEPAYDEEDGYQIANFGNLMWLSNTVNNGKENVVASVTADLVQGDAFYTPIGSTEHPFKGEFYGDNHSITLDLKNSPYTRQGLFGTVSGNARIAFVVVKGNIEAADYAGGIAGAVQDGGNVSFYACGNEANVTVSGANAGGIVGCNFSGTVDVENCYNAGAIKGGRESAAISGWLGNDAQVTNTYNCGTVEGVDGEKTFARWSSGTYTNCYNTLAANQVDGRTDSYEAEKVASGELCVALGKPFSQNLGEDAHPTYGHSEVLVYEDGTFGNDAPVASPYVGSELAEGTFYLRNADFGTWLGDNDRNAVYGWTSHAEIGARGRDIIITAIDGGYQLNPQTGGNHSINASNLYMDTGAAVTAWTFTPVESHTGAILYKITSGDKGLSANDAGDMDENSGKHNLWQLVTREERLAVETANATVTEPADISWAVLGGTFPVADDHKNDGTWQGEQGSNANGGDGFYHCNRVWEMWGITERNVYQEIANLPNGMYGVQANAIYVSTGNDGVNADRYNDYLTGTQATQGYVYASAKNDKAVEMINMYSLVTDERVADRNTRDLGNGKWALNGTNEYSTHIFEGAGLTDEARVDVNEGTIKVGVKVENGTGASWILFDNFRLFYYGDKVATGIENVHTTVVPVVYKAIENGKVVIYRNGQKYNVNGMMVK